MSLIISKNGKDAQRLNKTGIEKEDFLQQYIYDNPDAIPVYEIDEDIRLLVLAREFATNSGPIDALGVDQYGNIYIIETKLYKNPDKRTVVAQALDYGASLWRSSFDFSDFTMQLEKHVQKQFGKSLQEQLEAFFGISGDDVDLVLENMQKNLNNGTFKFVVLMDSLHRRLKDLILFMNQNSQFDVYAVELEYYEHESFEIIIPKMYGTEVKKDVVSSKTTNGGRKQWNEQMYWEEVRSNLDSTTASALRKLYDWARQNCDEMRWGTGTARGAFNPRFTHISPISFISAYTDGSLQISYGYLPEEQIGIRIKLRDILKKYIDVPGVTDVDDEQLKSTYRSIPPAYVTEHIDDIISGLQEFIKG